MSLKERIRTFSRSRYRDLFIVFISTVFGILAGPVVEQIAAPLFAAPNLPSISFIVIAVTMIALSIFIIDLWRSTQNSAEEIAIEVQNIADALGQQARLVSYDEAYRQGAKWLQGAKREVRIVTYYLFDWERGIDNYDAQRLASPERLVWFDALYDAIKRTKSSDLRFIRVVESPRGANVFEAIKQDEMFYRDCKLLAEIGMTHPEKACLRVSDIYLTNTFILIDGIHLFLEFDIHDPDSNRKSAPFVMIATDPTGENLKELLRLHQRIEAHSRLITAIE